MRYKKIAGTDIEVSVLGAGTWGIAGDGYGESNDKDSILALRALLDNGVNLIDTAPSYGVGHSEEVVGQAIKGYDRSKVLLVSKFGVGDTTLRFKNGGSMPCHDGTKENCVYEFEQSLKRLDTDYIDVYLHHNIDPDTPVEVAGEAMADLKAQGKVRFVGVSNYPVEMMERINKVVKLDFIQPPYSMVDERSKDRLVWAEEHGISCITYGSLGSGILTGAFRTLPTFPRSDPRGRGFYDFWQEPKFSACMKLLSFLDEIAAAHNVPVAQVAINWSAQKSYVTSSLCGVRNEEEARVNCAAYDWSLTEEEMAAIEVKLSELKINEYGGEREKHFK